MAAPTPGYISDIVAPWRSLWRHRNLLLDLCRRDLAARYKASSLGLLWAFLQPLLMLAIYAFVFGEVFRSRWGNAPPPSTWEEKLDFALILYAGLIIFNWFAECLARAPVSVLSQTSYVKRVVFPLEILPLIPVVAGGFHYLMSFAVMFVFALLTPTQIGIHWLGVVALLLPYILFLAGLSWLIAAIGVYFRDLEQIVPALTSAMMFLSPVFFAVTMLPAAFQPWMMANPLTFVIEAHRGLLFWQQQPSLGQWALLYSSALLMFYFGYGCFSKLRRGFADVL